MLTFHCTGIEADLSTKTMRPFPYTNTRSLRATLASLRNLEQLSIPVRCMSGMSYGQQYLCFAFRWRASNILQAPIVISSRQAAFRFLNATIPSVLCFYTENAVMVARIILVDSSTFIPLLHKAYVRRHLSKQKSTEEWCRSCRTSGEQHRSPLAHMAITIHWAFQTKHSTHGLLQRNSDITAFLCRAALLL